MKWLDEDRFFSCVDVFPIETGIWGGTYGGARPFLTAFSLPYSHGHLFLLANASEVLLNGTVSF